MMRLLFSIAMQVAWRKCCDRCDQRNCCARFLTNSVCLIGWYRCTNCRMANECCAGSDKHMTTGRIDQVENV